MAFLREGSKMEFFGTYLEVTRDSRLVWTNSKTDQKTTSTNNNLAHNGRRENNMKTARALLIFLFGLLALTAMADNPKAGVYSCDKDNITGDLHFAKKGAHFQVQGKMKFKTGDALIKGTLFTTTWKFKGTITSKNPKTGKNEDRPINGNWNHRSGCLTLYFPNGYVEFYQDKMESDGKVPNFTGTWDTSFGKMTLTQSGKKVSGTYDYYSGTIDGEIREDGNLYFKWTQKNPDKQGTGFFKLSSDASAFSGSWDYTNASGASLGNGGGWSGKRIK